MSQFDDSEIEDQVFDINDPTFLKDLGEIVPDIDPDAIPVQTRPAPIADGVYWVRVRLSDQASVVQKHDGAVYYKGLRVDSNTGRPTADSVVAVLSPRIIDENGQEKGFLKDWYASTATPKVAPGSPPKGSALTAVCKMAGKPIERGWDLVRIKSHVERIFAEAGEEGILVLVKTQWVKSVPKARDIGGKPEYVFKEGTSIKDYEEVKGMKKILSLAAKAGIPEDLAHIWYDPVTNEERTVAAQVQSIEDPAKYEIK